MNTVENIELTTGKIEFEKTDIFRFTELYRHGKVSHMSMYYHVRPVTDAERWVYMIALHALSGAKKMPYAMVVSIDAKNRRFMLGFASSSVRVYFRIRISTNDFVIDHFTVDGLNTREIGAVELREKVLRTCLQYVKKFVSSQKKMNTKKYPYVPKYNEVGWKAK